MKGIKSIDVYLCEEGMARFATKDYDRPAPDNINNLYMHLTNATLNKSSQEYMMNEPSKEYEKPYLSEDDHSSKRLFSSVLKHLAKIYNQEQIAKLRASIDEIAIKCAALIAPHLKIQFNSAFGRLSTNQNQNCFQVFGLDVLIDASLRPWILEINSNPSLNIFTSDVPPVEDTKEKCVSEVDLYLKSLLILDTIKLVTSNTRSPDLLNSSLKLLTLENGAPKGVGEVPVDSKLPDADVSLVFN